MDRGDGDEGKERMGEVLPILGKAPVSSEPGESALDHPSAWQDDEAAHVVGTLDDFQSQARDFGDGIDDLVRMIAAVGPDELEPGVALADLIQHQSRAVAILYSGGMDHDPDRQPFGVDERVKLAALHLLCGVVTYLVVSAAPFSADLSDWLSRTPAVGRASRPSFSRNWACRCAQMTSQTPSFWNLRKIL